MVSSIKKLLFVDTNIWLDFYRARTEAGLQLLKHLEAVADQIIVTYQLEMEFKKNRQTAILEGLQDLKPPQQVLRPGLLSDAKSTVILNKSLKEAQKRVNTLKTRLTRALANPTAHDPVYQACQRIFHRDHALVITREDAIRKQIKTKALRRFLLGCPPRKKNDTSFGDAFNWEWMIHCALEHNAELRDCLERLRLRGLLRAPGLHQRPSAAGVQRARQQEKETAALHTVIGGIEALSNRGDRAGGSGGKEPHRGRRGKESGTPASGRGPGPRPLVAVITPRSHGRAAVLSSASSRIPKRTTGVSAGPEVTQTPVAHDRPPPLHFSSALICGETRRSPGDSMPASIAYPPRQLSTVGSCARSCSDAAP